MLVDEPVIAGGGPASKPLDDADEDDDEDEDEDDDSVDPPHATIKMIPPPNAVTTRTALFIAR